MDRILEGRMAVKMMMMMMMMMMMIQERLSKTIVPTTKMFNVNKLELEKFLACV